MLAEKLYKIANLIQGINRTINTSHIELIYQRNYFELCNQAEWLKRTPLSSPRGGTASYTLLYIILSILNDKCCSNILELGAGKSTQLFASYVEHTNQSLTTVDHDAYWLEEIAKTSSKIKTVHAPLQGLENHHASQWYAIEGFSQKYDFVLIDGPPASNRKTKYDRLGITRFIPSILNEDFVILIDDASRAGERLLSKEIENTLGGHRIKFRKATFNGASSVILLASPRFEKFLYL
ncbi:methyltransferase domain-containing protein [Terrimicrobium sacchariphilum]|uniref:Methyltransferase domain-containing protein n=1 Tax=Terrimicrobium sacchariphilum TaxID=690879 RepID=A0A146G7I5_TERSA|nr:class I SAM-dependent methyltransferase [Terrimicrobium sacchariphilum]GAT32678.1 methyltransferase domain-containing protein [Terrimicrobium sacchariphilum]